MTKAAALTVQVHQYPPGPEPHLPCWDALIEAWPASAGQAWPRSSGSTAALDGPSVATDAEVAEQVRQAFEAGNAQGLAMGRRAESEALVAGQAMGEARRHDQVMQAITQFAEEKDKYFHSVEHEVAELALAIAARILRREAQMDPLLLTGAVRVALGQLSHSTEVRLCVPGSEAALWREAIEHVPNLALRPEVVARDSMLTGDCVIETELGSVDLGLRAQLGEIEHEFFDRAVHQTSPSPEIQLAVHDQGAER
jgi:flagellar biosynthesis/type III secretory pathway protein FliH